MAFKAKVNLDGGNWVELRDPKTVTERERRPLKRQFLALSQSVQGTPGDDVTATPVAPQLGGGDVSGVTDVLGLLDGVESFSASLAVFFVKSWSFDGPVTEDALLDRTASDFDAIDKAVTEAAATLFPELAKQQKKGRPTTP